MVAALKEGDRVRVVDREATTEDVKAVLFFNHFRSLTGTVQKVYPDQLVAVEVDQDSLTEPILRRHTDVQETMKAQWLDKLSEEARNRLTDQERDFRLRYTILVALKDLTTTGARRTDMASPPLSPAVQSLNDLTAAGADDRHAANAEVRRATLRDIEAAEAAELQRRRANREA